MDPPPPGCEMGSKDPAFLGLSELGVTLVEILYLLSPAGPSPSRSHSSHDIK